jgi:sulfur-oxidizing protein SoxX
MRDAGWRIGMGMLLATAQFAPWSAAGATESAAVAAGRAIAHDVYKGNCLACHQVPGDPSAVSLANIGPPIVDMRGRFPERARLREHLWDATVRNPYSVMPPFGRHRILTEEEIDLVMEYIYRY